MGKLLLKSILKLNTALDIFILPSNIHLLIFFTEEVRFFANDKKAIDKRTFRKSPLSIAFSRNLERETGFEPATSTLARLHSTTELFPLTAAGFKIYQSDCQEFHQRDDSIR